MKKIVRKNSEKNIFKVHHKRNEKIYLFTLNVYLYNMSNNMGKGNGLRHLRRRERRRGRRGWRRGIGREDSVVVKGVGGL